MNNVKKCSWSKRHDCRALTYLNDVLETSDDVIDAVTWHQYYLNGRTATVEDFLDPMVLNRLQEQMEDQFNKMNPEELMKSWLVPGMESFGKLQQAMWQAATGPANNDGKT